MCVCIYVYNIFDFFIHILYVHTHTPHLLFPLTLLGRAVRFGADFGGAAGLACGFAAVSPYDVRRKALGLALCPLNKRCLLKSFAAHRCILNTRIRVAARCSGAGGAVQAERQTVPKFSLLRDSCCCRSGRVYHKSGGV